MSRPWIFITFLVAGLASCSAADVVTNGFGAPEWACSDGWFSQSIGIQGACSHHGGVVNINAPKPSFLRDLLHGALNLIGFFCFAFAAMVVFGSKHESGDEKQPHSRHKRYKRRGGRGKPNG
jgi:hypothetical protein